MMRTPTNSRNSSQNLKRTTPKPINMRRQYSNRALSSDQMAATLYNISINSSPVAVQLMSDGENKVKASNILSSKVAGKTKSVMMKNRFRAETSSDEEFCEKFFGWLKVTQDEVDADAFARLKEDLYELVGKHTLANGH